MQSLTPLHETYSAGPPSSLSSDSIHSSGDSQNHAFTGSQARPSELHLRMIPRHSFLIRAIIFVLLEFGFIAFVCAALWNPIILHVSRTIAEVKGAVTVISIIWHTLAIYAVKDILLNIFSAEWTKQDDGSHNLSLQELDSVSRLTTGFVDQLKHFVSRRTTQSFRLAFLAFLLLIMLNGLGPGAIGVDPVPYLFPSRIKAAFLTIGVTGSNPSLAIFSAMSRASSITQLEIVENFTTLGYRTTQPNILVPWPSSDSVSENTTVMYESDIIRYDFSCSWNKPSQSNVTADGWVVGLVADINKGWAPYPLLAGSAPSIYMDPSIFPLMRGSLLLEFESIGSDSLSSFMFVGRNSSETYLSLEGIPSSLLPCNTTRNPTVLHGSPRFCQPLLVSLLVCDPQLEILPAVINVTTSSLDATTLPGTPSVKNVPSEAANTIFSSSLFDATSGLSHLGLLNAISSRLFFHDIPSHGPVKPLSLPEINKNMNKVLASSAKAYLNGFKPDNDNPAIPSLATVNTNAIVEVQKMALVGSKLFLVATSIIVGVLVLLLSFLVTITKADQLEGFELGNIIKRLQLDYALSNGV